MLDSAFDGSYVAGQVVRSVFRYNVTNNTTGGTGTAYLIRIYTGSDPVSPGGQDGPYYNAFDIPVSLGDSITLSSGNLVGQVDYSDLVVCFTSGTEILTKQGKQPIENLRVGDMIVTRDIGVQPLKWIGSKTMPAEGKATPICISAGTLGNSSDLLISPNHRMLISAASSDLFFGQQEVLISAKHLLSTPGIYEQSGGEVTYIHLLFDRHETV